MVKIISSLEHKNAFSLYRKIVEGKKERRKEDRHRSSEARLVFLTVGSPLEEGLLCSPIQVESESNFQRQFVRSQSDFGAQFDDRKVRKNFSVCADIA